MAKKSAKAKKATTKEPKKPRAPKTKATAPGAKAVQAASPGPGHNSKDRRTENEIRQGFLDHRKLWIAWQAKVKVLEETEKKVKSDLKADGYTVGQMKIADALAGSPKAMAKVQGEVRDRLQVARWIGHAMGNQLDMFDQPDRTPAVDRSYDAGWQASAENEPCKPPHSPETEQARTWIKGYQAHQAELSAGFKAPAEPAGEANGAAAGEVAEEPEPVTSGERVTRSEFAQRLKDQTATDGNGAPVKH